MRPASKQTTLRGIDEPLARRLRNEARRHGLSVNRMILRLLRQATGLAKSDEPVAGTRRFADLDHLIGTWSQQDAEEFDRALDRLRHIDEDLWR